MFVRLYLFYRNHSFTHFLTKQQCKECVYSLFKSCDASRMLTATLHTPVWFRKHLTFTRKTLKFWRNARKLNENEENIDFSRFFFFSFPPFRFFFCHLHMIPLFIDDKPQTFIHSLTYSWGKRKNAGVNWREDEGKQRKRFSCLYVCNKHNNIMIIHEWYVNRRKSHSIHCCKNNKKESDDERIAKKK